MTTLVTGGAGFIGSHVCRKLVENGEKVVVFENLRKEGQELVEHLRISDIKDKIEFVSGDITDFPHVFETIKDYEADKIIHTAAITFIPEAIKKPSLAFNVNTVGSFNLLEAGRILDIKKFIYISTSSTYGDFQYVPADEKHPLEPKDVYGATKVAADRLAISYYRTYEMPTSILRTSSVYGPGDLEMRVARAFIEKSLIGEPMEVHGGGMQHRDFSYVEDVADGFALALNSEKADGEVFNITGGTDHTIKDLAEVIKEFIPGAEIKSVGARKVDTDRGQLDISKAKKLLGFSPKYSLREGIKKYIKWYIDVYVPYLNLEVKNTPVIT